MGFEQKSCGADPGGTEGHSSMVDTVGCSPDGKYIATGCQDNVVRIFAAFVAAGVGGYEFAIYSQLSRFLSCFQL